MSDALRNVIPMPLRVERRGNKVVLHIGPRGVVVLTDAQALDLAAKIACACDEESHHIHKKASAAFGIAKKAKDVWDGLERLLSD